MRHVFGSPLRSQPEPVVFDYEEVARAFVARLTALVEELDSVSSTLKVEAPAMARHLALVSQQMAALALTALETWPKAERS